MFADIRSPLLRKNTSGFYPVRKDWHMEKAIKKYFPVFALPTLVAFAVFFIVPFVVGIYLSFCEFTTITDAHFVGLDNYIKFMHDETFIHALWYTALFTIVTVVTINVIAFTIAMLLTKGIKGTNAFRTVFFMPNLIGGIVLGYVWQFIFNKVFTSVIAGSVSMLTDPNLAIAAILIVSTWQYAGYIMMIYVTGLQSVPKDVLEASNVDGANQIMTLLKIKVPMIANTFTVCIFLTLVNSFKQFDLNLAITNGAPSRILGGKPVQSTEFLALNIYNTAIGKNQYALGQTKAVVFFIILAVVSLTQVTISKKKEVEM